MSDRIRAEFASRDLYRAASELSAEIRKRRAAEAEVARLRMEVDFVWFLLHEAEARERRAMEALEGSQGYDALLPGDRVWRDAA